jgi:hypothetical protein
MRRHVIDQLANLPATTFNECCTAKRETAFGGQNYRLFCHAQRAYIDHIEQLIVSCRISPAVRQPRVAALAALSLCDRVNYWYRLGGPLTATQVTEEYCQLAARMLGLA